MYVCMYVCMYEVLAAQQVPTIPAEISGLLWPQSNSKMAPLEILRAAGASPYHGTPWLMHTSRKILAASMALTFTYNKADTYNQG